MYVDDCKHDNVCRRFLRLKLTRLEMIHVAVQICWEHSSEIHNVNESLPVLKTSRFIIAFCWVSKWQTFSLWILSYFLLLCDSHHTLLVTSQRFGPMRELEPLFLPETRMHRPFNSLLGSVTVLWPLTLWRDSYTITVPASFRKREPFIGVTKYTCHILARDFNRALALRFIDCVCSTISQWCTHSSVTLLRSAHLEYSYVTADGNNPEVLNEKLFVWTFLNPGVM